MGQIHASSSSPLLLTPPEVGQRRQEYLLRLGIHNHTDARAAFVVGPPLSTVEAPDRLESTREHGLSRPSANSFDSNDKSDFDMDMNVLSPLSRDDFRVSYLRKLSYQHVWTPSVPRSPQHQTVCIFDWDDTLLPTSYVGFRQEEAIPDSIRRDLRGIEKAAKSLLEQAQQVGRTFIITNALSSWVEYSAMKFLPNLAETLRTIPVISARGEYEAQYPGEHGQWKVQAFLQVQRQLDSQIITNLISVGDSVFEMDAVHIMGREFAQAIVKTVKFRDNPSAEELRKELELVNTKFEHIATKAQNLKITLERLPRGRQKAGQSRQQSHEEPCQGTEAVAANVAATASTATSPDASDVASDVPTSASQEVTPSLTSQETP